MRTMMPWPKALRAVEPANDRFARAAIVPSLLTVALAFGLAGYVRHHHTTMARMQEEQASEGATLLALEGLHAFEQTADAQALMTLAVGADSMVMKARVFGDDRSMGTYAVSLKRVEMESFRLLATGRLVSGAGSIMCSVRGNVRLAEASHDKMSVGYETDPLCNGKRRRLTLTTQTGS